MWQRILQQVGASSEGAAKRARSVIGRNGSADLLDVRESRCVGESGLGVFARQQLEPFQILTEFAGQKVHRRMEDFEKRLMCVQIHGEEGWEAGLNKMYTTAPDGAEHFTVFGRNFPPSSASDAERAAFIEGGVAQIINDHSVIRWQPPLTTDMRDVLLRCASSMGPKGEGGGEGGGGGGLELWEDPQVLLRTFGLADLAAATDAYIANMGATNVALVPFAGSGEAGGGSTLRLGTGLLPLDGARRHLLVPLRVARVLVEAELGGEVEFG